MGPLGAWPPGIWRPRAHSTAPDRPPAACRQARGTLRFVADIPQNRSPAVTPTEDRHAILETLLRRDGIDLAPAAVLDLLAGVAVAPAPQVDVDR